MEVQERVVTRLPLLMPASPKLERASDPKVARVEADDLVTGMEDAAIARPGTAKWDSRNDPSASHDFALDSCASRDPIGGAAGRAHGRDHPARPGCPVFSGSSGLRREGRNGKGGGSTTARPSAM